VGAITNRRRLASVSIVRGMVADTTSKTTEPPAIPGVRRSFVEARGVRFHVTEAGPADGRPVIALHGWPQHHWAYRDLLADPPPGLRIIAPDLPGYGWSGPPPHRWLKEEIATDVLALADALGLDHFLLVGHDWGGYVGFLMVLQAPERIDGYLALNIAHPWQSPRSFAPHLWRFLLYQPFVASIGLWLQQRTSYLEPSASATRSSRAPHATPTAPSCCANCPRPEDTPRTGARPSRSGRCSGPATRRFTPPWRRPSRPRAAWCRPAHNLYTGLRPAGGRGPARQARRPSGPRRPAN